MRHSRRALAASVLMVIAQLTAGTPSAAGQPVVTTIPEVPMPPGSTVFTDDPSIVDSRPQPVESWSRLPAADAIAVHFTTGVPECNAVHVEVQETADLVAIKLRSGSPPDAVGRACILIALTGTLTVGLRSAVGDRAVVGIT